MGFDLLGCCTACSFLNEVCRNELSCAVTVWFSEGNRFSSTLTSICFMLSAIEVSFRPRKTGRFVVSFS